MPPAAGAACPVVRVDVADEIAYDAALRGDLHATPRI
jgi:hypothetical protein